MLVSFHPWQAYLVNSSENDLAELPLETSRTSINEPVGVSVTYGSISTGRRTVTTFSGRSVHSQPLLDGLDKGATVRGLVKVRGTDD